MTRDAGFTLLETLVSTALMLALTGTVFSLANARGVMATSQPESSDMQQRARAAADSLFQDLVAAGSGAGAGSSAGSLGAFMPPLVPRRMGASGADAGGVVRADAITLTWAGDPWKVSTTAAPVAATLPTLTVVPSTSCPVGDALCGLSQGDDALVFDDQAHFGVYRLTGVSGGVADLAPHDAGAGFAFAAGARVVPAVTRIYYFDAAARQLRVTDGYATDTPVIDNVVSLNFEYYGDPNPPVAPKPALGTSNCLYDDAGRRLGGLDALVPDGGTLARLPLSMLNDGPWCGENGARFDADLLRVRRVRVTLRVQAGPDMFRGTGPAFVVAGTSRRADQSLPDYVVTFDAAPRSLAPVR